MSTYLGKRMNEAVYQNQKISWKPLARVWVGGVTVNGAISPCLLIFDS